MIDPVDKKKGTRLMEDRYFGKIDEMVDFMNNMKKDLERQEARIKDLKDLILKMKGEKNGKSEE